MDPGLCVEIKRYLEKFGTHTAGLLIRKASPEAEEMAKALDSILKQLSYEVDSPNDTC